MKTTKQKIVLPPGWRKLRKGEIIRATDVEVNNIASAVSDWVYHLTNNPIMTWSAGEKVKCGSLKDYTNNFYRFTPQRTDNGVPGTEAQQ